MNSQQIVCAIAALSMNLSGVTFAQNDKDVRADEANRREHLPLRQQQQLDRQDRARAQPGWQQDRHDRARPQPGWQQDRHDRARPQPGWQQDRHDNRGPGRYGDRGRGAGPDHRFYRGGRLPPQYRQRMYVVDDWRGHHLNRPPAGYHWVQTGTDYVLVAIATGIIASILLNN
ncbi:MAG: RcnB family protein [Burkholderiales bacterium]